MTQITAQPLTVEVVSTAVQVEIAPATTTIEAQPLGRSKGGATQTAVIRPA